MGGTSLWCDSKWGYKICKYIVREINTHLNSTKHIENSKILNE